MKRLILFVSIIFCLVNCNSKAQDITTKKSIIGSWFGKLNAGAVSLRIVFNLSLTGNDSLVATLDSPDQGAKNIKLGPVTFDGKSLRISAAALLAEYNGTLKSDTLINGTWKQSGNTFDLNLTKLKQEFTLIRPQEPKPPFPYKSEDVVFPNEKFNIRLAGTVTIPEGKGPFPAVILITGSGPQNRDEELMGHKPFLVIADYLTRNGIAVLRYDDRGVGKSQGNYLAATSADLATDAEAAFNFLKNEPYINNRLIGFAGHSEGGLIAPIVASTNPEVAFIISLAGPGVSGEEIINRQNLDISLASGADIKKVKEGISVNKKLFDVLKSETDNGKAQEEINNTYKMILEKEKLSSDDIDQRLKELNKTFNPISYTWLRYFLSVNPADFWKKVRCPVLALNGEKDLQVAADVNLKAIAKALKSGGNKSVTVVKLPGLNHLFQHCKTGLPSEYGEIDETISPEVLRIMADWIHGLQVQKPAF